MGDFIHTEQELLDFIALPEVSLCSLKFCINNQNKQIDLECVFADGKGLFCENIQQLQINENFSYGLIGSVVHYCPRCKIYGKTGVEF